MAPQAIFLCCTPNTRAISVALIWDKKEMAMLIFKVLWVNLCKKEC